MEEVLMNHLVDATAGEHGFVDVIIDLAEGKPDHFKLYYEPNGKNSYPDFALYSKTDGLIFFEVKDLSIGKFNSFDHHEVTFTYVDGEDSQLPLHKNLTNKLKKEFQESNLGIPISELFVFPNLTEREVREKFEFDTSKPNRYFFKEHLFYLDDFKKKIRDNRVFRYVESPECRAAALLSISRKLPSSIVKKEKDLSVQPVLFEEFNEKRSNDLMVLNNNQEVTYRNFIRKRGYRFLKGHAGTGKTILLIMRAEQLAKEHKSIKIFLTYFTSQLDDVFKNLSQKYQNITAQRFTLFCMDNIKKAHNVGNSSEDWENYFKNCLDIVDTPNNPFHKYFDYVLVDEGQDFNPTQGAIIEKLAKGDDYKNKQILVAFDDFQALHQKGVVDTPLTFKGKQRGRVTILRCSFRTPVEIAARAQRLIGEEITSVRPVPNSFNHIQLNAEEDVIDYINRMIPKILDKKNLNLEDIGIIYPNFGYTKQKVNDIISKLVPPHFHYKTEYKKSGKKSLQTNKVKILNSTYSKGLEFKVVFLIFFDEVPNKDEINGNYKPEEHLYVAMTRATHYLMVLTKKSNDLIDLIVPEETLQIGVD